MPLSKAPLQSLIIIITPSLSCTLVGGNILSCALDVKNILSCTLARGLQAYPQCSQPLSLCSLAAHPSLALMLEGISCHVPLPEDYELAHNAPYSLICVPLPLEPSSCHTLLAKGNTIPSDTPAIRTQPVLVYHTL